MAKIVGGNSDNAGAMGEMVPLGYLSPLVLIYGG